MGGGGHLSFAKYTLSLPYIYPIILVKSGLTPCLQIKIKSLLFYIHFFLYIYINQISYFLIYREKESDKLLTSQDGAQNGQNQPSKSPKQSPGKNLEVQKKDNLTVSTASHSSLSRQTDVPQLRITEVCTIISTSTSAHFDPRQIQQKQSFIQVMAC